MPAPLTLSPARAAIAALPPSIWRGSDWRVPAAGAQPSGFAALDAELPGGGWPGQGLTELLYAQPATWEWRLLAPLLGRLQHEGRRVLLIGPPLVPHLPGWRLGAEGETRPSAVRCWVWVQARTVVERLWSAEQVLKANAAAAVLLWLPQVQPQQLRRLQVAAQSHDGPVFVCRPLAARHDVSAAPLRLAVALGPVSATGWPLQVQILKRRGPALDRAIPLEAPPASLAAVLPPRLEGACGWSLARVPSREPGLGTRAPLPLPLPPVSPPFSSVPQGQADLFDDALGRLLAS